MLCTYFSLITFLDLNSALSEINIVLLLFLISVIKVYFCIYLLLIYKCLYILNGDDKMFHIIKEMLD